MVPHLEVVLFLGVQMDGKLSRIMKIKLRSRAGEIWRIIAALVFCLVCLGCATPRVQVTAEIVDAEQAKSRSVAVVADLFMDDAVEANTVAELVRDQLASQGFKVKETESEAELVVIPTVERSKTAGAEAAPAGRMRRPFDVSYGFGQSSLMQSQNALRNLGFEFETLPVPEQPRVG
jgi:hypothetical protein